MTPKPQHTVSLRDVYSTKKERHAARRESWPGGTTCLRVKGSSLSLIVCWVSAIRVPGGFSTAEWMRIFLSFQIKYKTAWWTSLTIKVTLASLAGAFSQTKTSSNPRGGISCSLETKKDQMWLLYPKSKNKCCLFSSNPEQRTHLEGADKPHLISLSLVTILSLAAIQVMKACFGIILRMLYLYYLVQNIFNGCKIR